MRPFVPAGRQARSQYVIDWALDAEVGDTITYDELAEHMDLDVEDRAAVQQAARRALKKLEEHHHRTLETVHGVGYRVADVKGHLRRGVHQQAKANRALGRGLSAVESVDLGSVRDPEMVRHLETVRSVLDSQAERQRRITRQWSQYQKVLGKS